MTTDTATKTTERTVTVRDTVIRFAPDSAAATALLHCDSLGNVLLEELTAEQGKNLHLSLALQQAEKDAPFLLNVRCNEDSLEALVQIYREQLTICELNHRTETITKEVEVIPPFYRFCTWAFWLLFLFTVLVFAVRLLRRTGIIRI